MPLLPDGTYECECGRRTPLLSPTDTGIPAGEVVCTGDCSSLHNADSEEHFTSPSDGQRHHRLTDADVEVAAAYYEHAPAPGAAPAAAATGPQPAPGPAPAPNRGPDA